MPSFTEQYPPLRKIILDLCGGTGAWSRPYSENSDYDVRLVTLPKTDVRNYIPPTCEIYGILGAPPCTEFAGSGARWWSEKDPALLAEALEVANAVLRIIAQCQPVFWAVENPVGRFKRLVMDGAEPRLIFDPCDFGDPYRKKTLLWGNFNIPRMTYVEPEGDREGQPNAWYSRVGGKSQKTKEYRSATPPGFARAFFEANR